MTPEQELGALIKEAFPGEPGGFHPCAIFQDRLDCIRVIVRDCSITATRLNGVLTVLEDTHYKPGLDVELYVGFTIKGVRHFCQEHGIRIDSPVRIAEILDAILQVFPEREVKFAIDGIARRLVSDSEVDLTASNVGRLKKVA